ncbi:DNA/RNA helicase domain-containing protein [Nocardiopsis sp. NPDC006938]|uniref:DNA/RNA helicase domain-containing protein n=1 Tax=Nocardiopsis sp. NPDC006938 TaxID=3364337 RepID=UPI00367E6564
MPETSPIPLRYVHAGRVGDVARRLQRPGFVRRCVEAYQQVGFGEPGESEVHSWVKSWPPLLDALLRAGLDDLWIYLEFGTPEGDSRFDALLLGQRRTNELVAVVVELKQWTEVESLPYDRVRLKWDNSVRTHPSSQVASYTAFLRFWFDSENLDLDVRGLAYLHEADEEQVEVFRDSVQPEYACSVLSREQLARGVEEAELRARLLCSDARGIDEDAHKSFEASSWRPNRELLSMVADAIEREPSFRLVGGQQEAFLGIKAKVDRALESGRRSIVLVQGGPGSGKTALAMRLLGSYARGGEFGARFRSPSGALNSNLRRSTKEVIGSASLFGLPKNAVQDASLVLLDEAHRLDGGASGFETLISGNYAHVPVVVVFLDERQKVRPDEGVKAGEVRQVVDSAGIELVCHELNGSFRCNGSKRFATWVDALLYGDPGPWEGDDYDFAMVNDPSQMEEWLHACLRERVAARVAAGYCWSWAESAPGLELPGVSVEWRDHETGSLRHWAMPWNLYKEQYDEKGKTVLPASRFWATDPGGAHQVGCVYSAQGLEYQAAGVIFGPNLVRRGEQWIAEPRRSHDPAMRSVDAHDYLPLAKNIYRVLMTRGMGSCRVYSTDEETQAFLTSLVPRGLR